MPVGVPDRAGLEPERRACARPADDRRLAAPERDRAARRDSRRPDRRTATSPIRRRRSPRRAPRGPSAPCRRPGRCRAPRARRRGAPSRSTGRTSCRQRAPEQHERQRHERRPLVDRVDEPLDRRPHRCRPTGRRRSRRRSGGTPRTGSGWSESRDPAGRCGCAAAVVGEARGDDRLRDRRVLVHRDRVRARTPRIGASRLPVSRADLPPAFVPGAHAAMVPLVGEPLRGTCAPAAASRRASG